MTQPLTDEPVTLTNSQRTIGVATLHSIAQMFADSPDVPMPERCKLARHDLTTRQLVGYASLYGQPIMSGGTSHWITVPLASAALHGIDIELTLFGPHDDPQDQPGTDARWAEYNRHNAALSAAVMADDPAMVEVEYDARVAEEN